MASGLGARPCERSDWPKRKRRLPLDTFLGLCERWLVKTKTFYYVSSQLARKLAASLKLERCPGCGCNEVIDEGGLCRDCRKEDMRMQARLDAPKSWRQQLANAENPEL